MSTTCGCGHTAEWAEEMLADILSWDDRVLVEATPAMHRKAEQEART